MRLKRIILVILGAILLPFVILILVVIGLVIVEKPLETLDVTPGPPSKQPGNYSVRIDHEGRSRRYFVHVPPGVGNAPLPLVLVLHGRGGDAERMNSLAGDINAIADRLGFFVVFPEGVNRAWNDGHADFVSKVDDVGFLLSVIDDLAGRLPVDRERVYASGISNGAIMSTRLACDAADRFAAIAVVAGTANAGFEETCSPRRPVPMVIFLNTADRFIPYDGGRFRNFFNLPFTIGSPVASANELIAFWSRHNGCSNLPISLSLPDLTQADDSHVLLRQYRDCSENADIDFYRVDGAGHTWPGGRQFTSPWAIGTTNRDISASELIAEFFLRHSRSP